MTVDVILDKIIEIINLRTFTIFHREYTISCVVIEDFWYLKNDSHWNDI